MNTLDKLQQDLNYFYTNLDLLKISLTHRSYLNENRSAKISNERLEFLGDAVLELVSSQFLYEKFPTYPEGELTSLRAKIVQTRTLAAVAVKLNIGIFLKMSKGEVSSGGTQNISILADTVEAIIGSIFLDGGFEEAKKVVYNFILSDYEELIRQAEVEDWKSRLQEVIQAKGGNAPTYEVIKEYGPDHDRIFTIQVSYFDKAQEIGEGKSKQAAQQMAARLALEKFQSVQ